MVRLNLPRQATFKGPAALWKRIAAFFIDFFLLDFVIGSPFQKIIGKYLPMSSFSEAYAYYQSSPETFASLSIIMVAYGLLALLYFSILEYKTGQTIGKMLLKVKVEADHQNYFLYLIRSMFLLFLFPFMLLIIIDPVFMMFNKEGRRLSEILSKTRTVEVYTL